MRIGPTHVLLRGITKYVVAWACAGTALAQPRVERGPGPVLDFDKIMAAWVLAWMWMYMDDSCLFAAAGYWQICWLLGMRCDVIQISMHGACAECMRVLALEAGWLKGRTEVARRRRTACL